MVDLVCVPPELVATLWLHAKPYVRAAVGAADLTTVQAIESAVLDGRSLLWIVLGNDGTQLLGAVTTELHRTELSLACVITSCAATGLPHNWIELLAKIEDYARAEGCACVRLFGRRGWLRKLPETYAPTKVVLERHL